MSTQVNERALPLDQQAVLQRLAAVNADVLSAVGGLSGAVSTQLAQLLDGLVKPGEVRTFAAGQVPAGWKQIGGAAELTSQPATGLFSVDSLYTRTGSSQNSQWFVSTAQKLFVNIQGTGLVELNADLSVARSAVSIPNLGASYMCTLVPLADGNLLRLAGESTQAQGKLTQRYNVEARTFTTLASRVTDAASATLLRAAQAGDGKVYCVAQAAGTAFDMFDYAENAWHENITSAPSTATNCVGIVKLPSGNLLFCSTTGQYVFDVVTRVFTQVNSIAGVGALVSTAAGARLYVFNAVHAMSSTGLAFHDFDESGGTWVLSKPAVQRPGATLVSAAPWYQAIRNPVTGAVVVKAATLPSITDPIFLHHLPYTPAGTVLAKKL